MVESHDLWVVPLVCGGCGARLEVAEDAVIHYCARCDTAWELVADRLQAVEVCHLAGSGTVRLPFWIFPVRVTAGEYQATSQGEFFRLSGNVRQLDSAEAARPPLVVVPAFVARQVQRLFRSGRLLTLRGVPLQRAAVGGQPLAAIALTAADAAEVVPPLTLTCLTEELRRSPAILQGFAVSCGRGRLCTLPVIEQTAGSYLQPELNLEL